VWADIVEASAEGVVSSVSAYELQRNALKGLLVREDVEAFLEELPILCVVHDTLSMDMVQRAAHLGWGNGLSMADALILQAFLDEDVSCILTTDHDVAAYEGDPEVEVL
jgi:predicted nucleic acid-binding protein